MSQKGHLEPRTERVLEFITEYINKHGIAPSQDEIAEGTNYSNASAIRRHIKLLIEAGYIEHTPHRARSIRLMKQPEIETKGEPNQ